MSNQLIPAYMPSPGEMIADELEARELSIHDLAVFSEELPSIVNSLIQGHTLINNEIAEMLSEAFGISSSAWLNLERSYQTYLQNKI